MNTGTVGINTSNPSSTHKLDVRGAVKIDGGTNSIIDVISDDNGRSEIRLVGSSQGTGRVFVGQAYSYGGGIEYNGDGSPATTGAGSDQITLFRRNNGIDTWTARNYVSNNNWEFRGNVSTQGSFSGKGSIQYFDLTVYSNTDIDQTVTFSLPSGHTLVNIICTTSGFDVNAIKNMKNNSCVSDRYNHEINQNINLRIFHTKA